jgi:arsenical pump membrane protein
VNVVAVLATLGVLLWYYNSDVPATYAVADLKPPRDAIAECATFYTGFGVLGLLLAGFFWIEPLGVPISAVAGVGAVLLLVAAACGKQIDTRAVLAGAPWQIVIFSLGMYLVVYGLRNAGLTDLVAAALDYCAQYGVWGAAMGTGLLTAALASVMNNLPTVLIGALSIDATHAHGAVQGPIREAMIYANVIGSDLGPKITPIGSLATLLWLHVLAEKDIRISWAYYFKVGIVLTLPVLLLTLAALAVRLS